MEQRPCQNKRRSRPLRTSHDCFEARSFEQTAEAPVYKGTAKGTHQGHTSYIPYRRTILPDVAQDIRRPQRTRITPESHSRERITEDLPANANDRSPPTGDTTNRVVTPHAEFVNSDGYEDIVVQIEGSTVVPVLYGTPDGTFQWTIPPKGN